jgi:hypothetical protein
MPGSLIDPWFISSSGISTNMSPPNKTVSFTSTPTPGVLFGLDLVIGQGNSGTLTTVHTNYLTPFPNGLGKHSKFYSGAGAGTGFMTSYGSTGQFTAVAGTTGGKWGSQSNEFPYYPIFCTNNTYNNADCVNIINAMATNYPGVKYGLCPVQEADAKNAQGASWASGQLESGPITATNLAAAFLDAQNTIQSMGAGATAQLILCLTAYRQADYPLTGGKYTDYATAFNAAGVQLTYIMGDIYQGVGNMAQGHPTSWTANYHMDWMASAAALFGCKIIVGEYGVTLSYTQNNAIDSLDNDTLMSQRLTGIHNWMKNNNLCVFGSYWMDASVYGLYGNTTSGCNPLMASVPITLGVLQSAIASSA